MASKAWADAAQCWLCSIAVAPTPARRSTMPLARPFRGTGAKGESETRCSKARHHFKRRDTTIDTTARIQARWNWRKAAISLAKLVPRLGLEPILWLSASLVIVGFRCVYLAVNMRDLTSKCKH